jgi:DNA-binding PadR family transcriptional regulator
VLVGEGVNEGVKARLAGELSYLLQNGSATRKMLEQLFGVSPATVERDISLLRRFDLIRFEGAPRKGRYVLTEKGKSELQRTEVPITSEELAKLAAKEQVEVSRPRTRDEIEKIVGPELEHIPRGARGSSQNKLRMLYNALRRNSLGLHGSPQTKEEVLRVAIHFVREDVRILSPNMIKTFLSAKCQYSFQNCTFGKQMLLF